MNLSKFQYVCTPLKNLVLHVAILASPYFVIAQTYQQDTATINRHLTSARNKRYTDTTSAINEANQALMLAQKHHDNYWIYKSYQRIANIYLVNNQAKKAHDYFLAPLENISNLHDTIKKNIYSEVASSYLSLGDYRSAYKYHLMNYELGVTTKNIKIEQISNLKLGMFYKSLNDFEKATQHLIKSLELSIKINNLNEISNSYRQLAAVYLRSKNFDLALQNSLKSVSYSEQIIDPTIPLYYIYLSYGQVLSECGQYQKSVSVLEKALILAQKVGDKTGEIDMFRFLGDTYIRMNNLEKADIYYKQCAVLTTSMTDVDLMSFHNSISKLYLKKNEFDKAIIYLNKSIFLATKYDEKQLLQNNYELLSDAYDKKGDTQHSLLFLKKSVQLQASIFTEENTKRIAEAQFKYDLVKNEEQMKIIQLRQIYTTVIGISVCLLLLLIFLIYYSRTKIENNNILKEKNKEIKVKNSQLEESNEILRQFAYASAHDLKEPLRSINSFVNILQKSYMKDAPLQAHEYMGYVTTGVRRMESLLNALLEFSSILTDDNIASKKNDVPIVLKDVFHHYESLINEKKAVIRYPSVFPKIFMNETHLKQILFNVVNNALKYSKEEAKVEIGYYSLNDELIFFVKDEGIGMEKSYSDKIFKLFQRLDKTTHKESVGIGLTICKNIVDKYAGRLWFESVVNESTTFYIAFPKSMISDMPSSSKAPRYLEIKGTVLEANLSV
jgi:signal transduction histidine kinase